MARATSTAAITAVALLVAPATSAAPIFYAGTGHYYERIDGLFSATEARADAATKSYLGVTGHLVTITSAGEDDHVNSLGGVGSYWIGASDVATEGTWVWDAGPEAGQAFWQGATGGTALGYENWDDASPDNFLHTSAGEDYAGMNLATGEWGDTFDTAPEFDGYIIEFSLVPEPSTLCLFAVGLLALRRRTAGTPTVAPYGSERDSQGIPEGFHFSRVRRFPKRRIAGSIPV
jgi:hypothetical protein